MYLVSILDLILKSKLKSPDTSYNYAIASFSNMYEGKFYINKHFIMAISFITLGVHSMVE
jgi:hypothetical protein